MAARKDDLNGMQPESSNEDSSTLNTPTREQVRDYAYFAPIGETVHKDDNDEIWEKEDDSDGFHRTQSYIDEDGRRELQRIATAISRNRPSATRAEESFRTLSAVADIPLDDPALDPTNPGFDLTKWIRAIMAKFIQEGHANQTTGLVFKDLNVSGSGSALQLQDTVTTLLAAPTRIGELFSFRKKDHKQILRSFNGYMSAGELCIVLGRPGSGCSTLLKSVTGQLHGLKLEDGSIVHFDGIPQQQMSKEF
jgi:ABC-type multidrug transport system fused ATPase/permease subunit